MASGSDFSMKKALVLAGAIIALVVGAGFATGQEIVQYFTAYGLGGFLVITVFAVVFVYYNFNFANVGAVKQFEVGNDIYRYYCGKYIGTFFDYYSTFFCYLSFFVMVGGAAATLQQGFGAPLWLGGLLITAFVVAVVSLGLNRLVEIIGIIGPINILFLISIGIVVLAMDWSHIPEGLEALQTGQLQNAQEGEGVIQAGGNWLQAGLSYAGFVLLFFASFMSMLGSQNSRRNVHVAIVVATGVICTAIAIIFLAQMANINTSDGETFVWNAPIPNLILALRIWPPLLYVFVIVVFIGVGATAVPLLYNPVARFAKEGTVRFRMLAVVLGSVGLVIGLFFPYRLLVNGIYVLNGYIGALLLVFMVVRNIRDLVAKKHLQKGNTSDGDT